MALSSFLRGPKGSPKVFKSSSDRRTNASRSICSEMKRLAYSRRPEAMRKSWTVDHCGSTSSSSSGKQAENQQQCRAMQPLREPNWKCIGVVTHHWAGPTGPRATGAACVRRAGCAAPGYRRCRCSSPPLAPPSPSGRPIARPSARPSARSTRQSRQRPRRARGRPCPAATAACSACW